jgi:hypothetical protein
MNLQHSFAQERTVVSFFFTDALGEPKQRLADVP